MQILHIITSTGVGGGQIMLLRYLKQLGTEAANHRVLSLSHGGPLTEAMRDLGVKVDELNVGHALGSILSARILRSKVSDMGPDLIVGWMYHGCMAAQAATIGRPSAPPIVWSIHHSLDDIRNEKRTTQIIIRSLAALSKRPAEIVYCSEVSRTQHEALGFSRVCASVIPNGIDTDSFLPDPAKRAWLSEICSIPAARFIIGNVARSHPMKDHSAMLSATAILIERGYDCQAVIVGPEQTDGPALAVARELGIEDHVTLFDSRDDISSIVAGFDVFLLSSAWGEAFPLVLGEAMSAGVPVVTTNVGDTAALVGDCGSVVAPKDPVLQADAVERFLVLPEKERVAFGLRGRDRIMHFFSIAKYVHRHAEVFNRARAREKGHAA